MMISKKSNLPSIRGCSHSSLRDLKSVMNAVPDLPNRRLPVVVRTATIGEIVGIPRDRFSVKVLGSAVKTFSVKDSVRTGEEQLVVAISCLDKARKEMASFRKGYRVQVRKNGAVDELSFAEIFHAPIDEDKLSDCILGVISSFFHGEESCTIYNMKFCRMEFCVLVQLFFKYIGILKKESRLPFSTYLQKKVFVKKSEFGVRTYNKYAGKDIFQKFAKDLESITVDFKRHPKYPPESNENILKLVFQEIGWAFQHSDYFIELRELRKTMETFNL